MHAVVAGSAFPGQNVQSTPCSEHFWKMTCSKSARSCGAKHISKSKCTKHTMFGPLFEVVMSKKVHGAVARSTFPSQNVQSTPCSEDFWKMTCSKLWGKAHFQVKMFKAPHVRTTFGCSDVVARGRRKRSKLRKR